MIKKIVGIFVLLVAGILLLLVFIPRKYSVPELKPRAGTRYWNLTSGSKIAYTLIPGKGIKQPYPIIFLQGGPGGPINDWNITTLATLAEDGYNVYLYDQAGCGLSSRIKNISEYTADRQKQDLEEIVKKINAGKVILIGQSWGAILAAMFIADNPGRVEKVLFTGPGPLVPVNYDLEKIPAPDTLHLKQPELTNRQGRQKVYTLRAHVVEFCASHFNWKLASDKEMDDFTTVLNYEMSKSTVRNPLMVNKMESGSGYYCMIKTVQSFNTVSDLRPKLASCRIPALILRGQYDGIKWGYVTEYLNLFPNHTFAVIPNAGHSIARELPDVYTNTIRAFLTGKSQSEP